MQFIDLQKQYQRLKNQLDASIQEVLDQSDFIMGKKVLDLEMKLAEYVGTKHCVTCANGTDALTLTMMAYDIKHGDAVFVPTFTFFSSAETVSLAGATPVFVDIDPDTFNIDYLDLESAIKQVAKEGKLRPRAVMAVDLFGLPYNEIEVRRIAENYNLLVIEDAAQGFGGSINSKRAGSLGDIATTSFFPAKPLGCYGDGGAIFTNEDKVKDYLESVRVHGKGTDKYDNVRIGVNSRLDTLQAAILIAKLEAFKESELELRNKVAREYKNRLKEIVRMPYIPDGYLSSYAQYSILLSSEMERDHLQAELRKAGIPTMIYYRTCMHQQTAYRNNPYIYRSFKNAEETSKTILNLPMHPYLEIEEINFICDTIIKSI
jgi:dTDP-4-amino-4,6-dideoxygalactose transaminase